MLTLININLMKPPIGPIALDYIAGATVQADIETEVLDLCFCEDPDKTLGEYFAANTPQLAGITFRNIGDCFWPSAQSFVPDLIDTVKKIKKLSDAPIVIGGVGFSIFARRLIECTDADFGIRGDGEQAVVRLYNELQGSKCFEDVAGLLWRCNGLIRCNEPAWPQSFSLSTSRNAIDNVAYFKKGGQCGLETKRGCNQKCLYCADPLAKGTKLRLRAPAEVADEVETLLAKGIDVLHLCDSEFNIPRDHAYAVCEKLIHRRVGERITWYAYLAVVPFDAELADAMRRAGCVGINFTGDSANDAMLNTYRQPHRKHELASAVKLCRENSIKVMIDLLLGGPGETEDTIAETIEFIKQINPDCSGASLGVRICPGTGMEAVVAAEGPLEKNLNIRRKYLGPVDFFKPTYYISHNLGSEPARLVQDLIAGDNRFFEPMLENPTVSNETGISTDHNYNDNTELAEAIERGARGAYWDILHKLRIGET